MIRLWLLDSFDVAFRKGQQNMIPVAILNQLPTVTGIASEAFAFGITTFAFIGIIIMRGIGTGGGGLRK